LAVEIKRFDFTDPNAPWQSLPINIIAWSGNGRYFEFSDHHFDLLSHTVVPAPYPSRIGAVKLSYDGQKAYYVGGASGSTADLMAYDFTTGTTQVLFSHTASSFVSPTDFFLLSPDGNKIALVNRTSIGRRLVIYDLTTNTSEVPPIAEQTSAFGLLEWPAQ